MHAFKLSSASTKLSDTSCFRDILGPKVNVTFDGKPAELLVYRLPDLWLASGEIVAADGFIMDRQPFTRRVKPGKYPVMLAIAAFGDDERVAFAQIWFAERQAVLWEMALVDGQDIAKLEPGYSYGYGVDSGTGCFSDPKAQELINEASDPDMIFFDEISAEMNKVYRHTRAWVHIQTERGSAALFSSGFGDGMYTSYFGLDEGMDAVAIVTDFGVVDWLLRP